jgi:Arm DNA-binding domain/Phage integrase family
VARKKLTAVSIPSLPTGDWPDSVVPDLILRVGAKRKTWTYRYRRGAKRQRQTLGYFPRMGIAEARDAARKAGERIDRGAVPAPSDPHPRSADALTLGDLIDRYEALRTREGGRIRSLPEAMSSLRRNLASYLALPAVEFSKADLREARDKTAERGIIAANRLLAYLGPVMQWAAEEDLIAANFVGAVRRSPEQERTRKLTDAEIVAIWRACTELNGGEVARNYGRLVRFLLITAQRRDEAASLRHGHILNGTWRQTENKSDRPHSIPLPALARDLVGHGEARELVFAGRSGGKFSGYSKLKAALDEVSGVSSWVLHDLRRTAASRMQTLRVPNHVVELILNHALPGIGGVYLQAELEDQKAEALETWATALSRLVRPKLAVR